MLGQLRAGVSRACACATPLSHRALATRARAPNVPPTSRSEDAFANPEDAPPVRRSHAHADVVDSILAGVREDRATVNHDRVLSILVDNEAGVLNRACGLLSARGFNIESLTVSPTNIPDLSRMTIVIGDVPEEKAAQALKQLNDVVNVWAVVDYTGTNSLQRELVMVKVEYLPGGATKSDPPTYKELLAAQGHRASVRDLGALFGAEVVDVGSRHITFQLTSWSRRIDAFVRMCEPWGVIEVARSGVVAMLRSPVSGHQTRTREKGVIDVSALPPG